MIAKFPKFTQLDISHQTEIKSFTSKFEPYSDFNFTSLFAWNTDGSTTISTLNNNLVINLPDYITGKPVYSILGKTKIDESMMALFSKTRSLKLVPEVVVQNVKNKKLFRVREDEDNFDYIYRITDHASLSGGQHKGKRKRISRFNKSFGDRAGVKQINLSPNNQRTIKKIFADWAKDRKKPADEVKNESTAIDRLLKNAKKFELISVIMTIDKKPVGFSINEVLNNKYAVCHFHKSILRYDRIDVYFSHQVAKILDQTTPTHINWEQDLGLPGLRELKSAYKPDYFLKKYIVKLNQPTHQS